MSACVSPGVLDRSILLPRPPTLTPTPDPYDPYPDPRPLPRPPTLTPTPDPAGSCCAVLCCTQTHACRFLVLLPGGVVISVWRVWQPYTPNPQLITLHPKPSTQNPTPQTLYSEPRLAVKTLPPAAPDPDPDVPLPPPPPSPPGARTTCLPAPTRRWRPRRLSGRRS